MDKYTGASHDVPTMNDSDRLLAGELDLHEYFQVPLNVLVADLRRQYRRLALVAHPDKPGGSHERFNLVARVYEILSNETLKSQYMRLFNLKLAKDAQAAKVDDETKLFQEQLRKAEARDSPQQEYSYADIEALRAEGMQMRQEYENAIRYTLLQKPLPPYISYLDLPNPPMRIGFGGSDPCTVTIVWKHRAELDGLFDENVLRQIMQVFGELYLVRIATGSSSSRRYDSGILQYVHAESAQKALDHNYKHSAKLWDGSSVRKLASLLRECKPCSNNEVDTVVDSIFLNCA